MSEELPLGWTRLPLRQLAQRITKGTTPTTLGFAYRPDGVRFVKAESLRDLRIDPQMCAFIGEDAHQTLLRSQLQQDDLLFTIAGTLGRVAKVQAHDLPANTNQAVAIISLLEPAMVDYVSRYLAWAAQAVDGARGTGLQNLNLEQVGAIEVCVPPLAEQRRIVARIEALFARTRQARADLERIAPLAALHRRATLTVAASGALTEAWRDAHSDLPDTRDALEAVRRDRQRHRKLSMRHRVAAAPEIDLPPSWEWASPDELASDEAYSIGIGPFGSNLVQSDYRPAGVRLVFVRDIRRERFDEKDARYVTPEKADALRPHMVMGGEILITKMGDPPGDTTIYPYGMGNAIITSDCIKLQPDPRLGTPEYLAYAIRSRIVADQIGDITKGVAQQKVSLDSFRRIALPTPPIAEQREIAMRLEASLFATSKLEREASRARALLDRLEHAILAQAFRGELVPQDPADEPASASLVHFQSESASGAKRRGRRAA